MAPDELGSGPRRAGNVRRLVLFYGVFVAVLVALGLYVGLRGLRLNLLEAESRTQNAAQALQQHMLRAIEATDLTLLRVADHFADRDLSAAARSIGEHQFLAGLAGRLPQLRALWIFDASGRLRLDSSKFPAPPIEIPERDAFLWAGSVDKAELHISDPVPGKFTGRPFFAVSRRIVSRHGGLLGLVTAAMEPGYFEEFHRAMELGAHGEITLFKTSGVLLDGRPRQDEAIGRFIVHRRALREIEAGKGQGTYRDVEGGVERILSFRRLERVPLVVTAAYTLADVHQEILDDLFTPSLGILVCFTFMTVLFGFSLVRVRREDALHAETAESELLFRSVVNNAGAGIALVALDGVVRLANNRLAMMLGYEPGEIVQGHVSRLLHPDEGPVAAESLARLAAGETTSHSREARFLRKDGQIVWVALTATLKPAALASRPQDARQEALVVAVVTDISSRKQAEEALQESRKTTQALLDAALESALLLDTRGNVLALNEKSAAALGRDPETAIGRGLSDLLPPDQIEGRMARIREVVAEKRPILFSEVRQGRTLDTSIHPVFDPQGEVARLAVFSLDTTERNQALEALRKAEEKYRTIFRNAPLGIYRASMEGRFLEVNPRLAEILGFESPEDVLEKVTDIARDLYVVPEYRREVLERIQKAPGLVTLEGDFRRRDGSVFTASLNLTLVRDERGAPLFIEGMVEDVTARKAAEEELRRTSEQLAFIIDAVTIVPFTCMASDMFRAVYMGPSVQALTGFPAQAFLDDPNLWAGRIHPEDQRRVVVGLSGIHDTGRLELEYRFRVADGSHRWLASTMKLVRAPDGGESSLAGVLHDVTSRKRAEEALKKSTAVLKETQRIARLGGFEIDMETRAFRFADEIVEILEVDPAEVLSLDALIGRFTPEHRPAFARAVEAAFSQGWPFDLTLKLATAAGKPMWARVIGRIEGKNGGPARLVGTIQDVTSLKLAEEAAKKSEQMYRTLLNVLPYGVVEIDRTGVILYNNQALRRITGHVEGELAGSTVFDLQVSDVEREAFRAELARIVRQEPEPIPWQGRFFTKHGRVIDVEVAWDYKRDDEGRVTGFISVITDITARKQAEEELKQSEFKLRTVADFTFDWEFWIRKDLSFEYVSPSCERICGYPAEAFLGDPDLFTRIVLADDREAFLAELMQGFASPSLAEIQYRILHKNGGVRWLALGYQSVIDPDGVPSGLRGSIRDVTAEREAQALREDVERITRHDLKGPLMTAMLIPKLLMRKGPLNPDQRDLLQEFEESSYRMLNTINSSLALYKIETRTYELKPAPLDILPLIRKIAAEFSPSLEPKASGVDILLAGRPAADDDRAEVQGEESLCYSLFENLIKNAIEAAPHGTRITVRLDPEPQAWAAAIHNQGAVPLDIRERFFEKYATSGKRYGTGLGTYLAKLIAETHQGSIEMRTSEEEGTTLIVRLPR